MKCRIYSKYQCSELRKLKLALDSQKKKKTKTFSISVSKYVFNTNKAFDEDYRVVQSAKLCVRCIKFASL